VLQEKEKMNHNISPFQLFQAKGIQESNNFLSENWFKFTSQILDFIISELHGTLKDVLYNTMTHACIHVQWNYIL
jgi:hypothetical protein